MNRNRYRRAVLAMWVVIAALLGPRAAMAVNEWSDIPSFTGRYSRIYFDYVVNGPTATFYCINDWMTNQAGDATNSGLRADEYNRFNFTLGADAYEVRIGPDGTGTVLKNGVASALAGFISKMSWSTSPNDPFHPHTIWEWSFNPPGGFVTGFTGHDPTGPSIVVTPNPPPVPSFITYGSSVYGHCVDGQFSDGCAAASPPPVPPRAYQDPVRDPHFEVNDVGWSIQFRPTGGCVVRTSNQLPILTQWGMVILVVMLLGGGTVGLLWRRKGPSLAA